MMDADSKNVELSEETGDPRASDDRQLENVRNAINSYAVIHLAMARRHPDWHQWSAQEEVIGRALGWVYQALSRAGADGSLCVTLKTVAGQVPVESSMAALQEARKAVDLLLACGLMQGQEDAETGNVPLVYDPGKTPESSRIYFQRYWQMEKRLAGLLVSFATGYKAGEASFRILDRLIPEAGERRQAVEKALNNRLSIISGGPGTGKTTAVAGVLECLLASDSGSRIVLAAPTGKAAGRMLESIKGSIGKAAGKYPYLREKEPELVAHTMHKWLVDPQANGQRPSADRPLDCDVLVIDEASMIDIELAVRFLSVIDAGRTRVILLGDPYQLAAVGPGSVLADICDKDSPLNAFVSELTVSYRFPEESPLGKLSKHIKEAGSGKPAFIPRHPMIADCLSSGGLQEGLLPKQAEVWIGNHLAAYSEAVRAYPGNQDAKALWDSGKRFQALAASRHGKMSVEAVNRYAQKCLDKGLEGAGLHPLSGQQVIVRKNSSVLDIYNGDIGIVLPQAQESNAQNLQVYFGDRQKTLALGRLPQCEPAFAITIHQSQGSEYEEVAVFLPVGKDNRLATKELLYTAVTRVRADKDGTTGQLTLFGEKTVYETAVRQATERTSGLIVRLKEVFGQKGG